MISSRRNLETDRAQQIGDTFAALHRFLQAAGEELDVFLVGFQLEFSFREMFGQRFIVVIDQLDQRAPQFQAHFRIDHDLERRRARIRQGQIPLFRLGRSGRDELIIAWFVHRGSVASSKTAAPVG